MSLQWTFIAACLYIEIAVIVLLLLPFISPPRWQKVFRSRLLKSMAAYGHIYFNVFIGILVLLFLDSVREVRKYAGPTEEVDLKHNPEAQMMAQMKLFRSQRNFYIAGFALFLFFIIRRLVVLISTDARLMAECEASRKQAEGATDAARRLMEDKENKVNKTKEEAGAGDNVGAAKGAAQKLDEVETELKKTKDDLHKAQLNLESMKKQAEATNTEYDRLLKEHSKLQEKFEAIESTGGKKDN
ncbi:B-cell receptor-associated protein 31-like [Haliotis rufescens]|uniref:B-cell receptor-associated protein 31-like n=1 Tax=Haliotis rufescens TaxID=6454 RepID=UPI001EB085B7|nr:B-cell receptor-associated protein 31-like [Haliotis rufescens]XP_048252930.1 B-cell receptor-associated protein 31-like [Haliotis rufescens]